MLTTLKFLASRHSNSFQTSLAPKSPCINKIARPLPLTEYAIVALRKTKVLSIFMTSLQLQCRRPPEEYEPSSPRFHFLQYRNHSLTEFLGFLL